MSIAGKWFGFGRHADYDDGMRAYDRGDYVAAASAFAACLGTCDDPATCRLARFYLGESHVRMAEAHLRSGRYVAAIESLEQALELQPNYPDILYRLAVANGHAGNAEAEADYVERALKINPNYAEALLHRGALRYEAGDANAGIAAIRRAAELDASLATEEFAHGMAAHERGDSALAARSFRALVGAHKDDANHHARLADGFVRERRFAEAEAEYAIALRIMPGYADVRCKRGQALLELDRVEEAEAEFRQALEINPKYVEAHAQLGIALKRQGKNREARECFKKAVALDPLHVIASQEVARLP